MNRTILSAIIAIAAVELIALAQAAGDNQFGATFGLVSILGTLICLVGGVILCIFPTSREVGKGLLIAAGVLFLIGLSVCSTARYSFR